MPHVSLLAHGHNPGARQSCQVPADEEKWCSVHIGTGLSREKKLKYEYEYF